MPTGHKGQIWPQTCRDSQHYVVCFGQSLRDAITWMNLCQKRWLIVVAACRIKSCFQGAPEWKRECVYWLTRSAHRKVDIWYQESHKKAVQKSKHYIHERLQNLENHCFASDVRWQDNHCGCLEEAVWIGWWLSWLWLYSPHCRRSTTKLLLCWIWRRAVLFVFMY